MLKFQRTQAVALEPDSIEGKLIAVSSAYGSAGKTLVATNLAIELAKHKNRVLLIDLDFLGPSLANVFALTEPSSGLMGALRIASQNRLDFEQLKRLSVQVGKSSLSILPAQFAMSQIERGEIDELLRVSLESFDFVVLDQSFLGGDDPISKLQLEVFEKANEQILVALADPVGVFRLLALGDQFAGSGIKPKLLINRLRNSVLTQAKKEIEETLASFGSFSVSAFLPDDPSSVDRAVRDGQPLGLGSRSSALQQALTGFVRTEIQGRKGRLESRVAKLS